MMNSIISKKLSLIFLPLLLLAGCASSLDDKTYSRGEAKRVHTIEFGTLEAINSVTIEGDRGNLSRFAGAVVGGIAGSSIGSGKGSQLGASIGAIAGSIAGGEVEERATRAAGLELTVRKDNGELISVVQEAVDDERFEIGQRVKLVRSRDGVRVTPWS